MGGSTRSSCRGTQEYRRGTESRSGCCPGEERETGDSAKRSCGPGLGQHWRPTGTIEQITVFGSNGQPAEVFATSEFTQNPHGFYQNNWPGGSALLVLGLIIGGLALGLPVLRSRKRQQQGWNVATSAPMNAYPQANPYQGPTQYPQYAPPPQQPNPSSGPYPPQPGGYDPPRQGNR